MRDRNNFLIEGSAAGIVEREAGGGVRIAEADTPGLMKSNMFWMAPSIRVRLRHATCARTTEAATSTCTASSLAMRESASFG